VQLIRLFKLEEYILIQLLKNNILIQVSIMDVLIKIVRNKG